MTDVLVADDEPELNELIGSYVTLAGFSYLPVHTGRQAIEAVRTHRPAMVLLDLMMPDLSGFDVCEALKAAEESSGVPILVISAFTDAASRRRALESGAADFLTKPFDPDQLLDWLRKSAPPRAP
jgi:DNA-binding response OmpR family regulator